VAETDADRGRLTKLVDAKVNVKAFEELEGIEQWLDDAEERHEFTIKNPQKQGVQSKMTEEKMIKQYYMNVVNKEEVKALMFRDREGRNKLA
jgi:hypothetical protein